MKQNKAELLAAESADWFHRGLISAETAQNLAQQYDGQNTGFFAILGRWLGIFAVILLASAVMFMMIDHDNTLITGSVILVMGIGCWIAGIKTVTSRTHPLPITGSAIITVSFLFLFAALTAFCLEYSEEHTERYFYLLMFVIAFSAALTAYVYKLRWPLFLSILLVFQAVGASGWYGGRGSYYFDIAHPPSMALTAFIVILIGLYHRRQEDRVFDRFSGFGRIMIILGLVYLNCSLWFLSLGWYDNTHLLSDDNDETIRALRYVLRFFWLMIFTGAAIGQLIVGAYLKDRIFTGFGIVFLSINLYTQFFERCWDKLSAASFFMIVGASGLLLGYLFERLYLREKRRASEDLPTNEVAL
ncbi:hypothetical protein WJT86_00565 [Microvirga sp. W0021]|uniref:DUF2157 domain-containing protein n=1 Tax=Hohaiivirga grylli TaxID=3133970 RepID=A0ABV0BEZ8_9HYPH